MESLNNNNNNNNNVSIFPPGPPAPEILLKRSRRQARLLAKEADERSAYERVRCVALSRIVYGDNHWQLAKAYAKLAEAYLQIRGLCYSLPLLQIREKRSELRYSAIRSSKFFSKSCRILAI